MDLWSFSSALGGDAAELRGMSVQALDGSIGRVQDVVDQTGGASYLIVDVGSGIFGKTVMLPAGVVSAVDARQRSVFIDRAKGDVENSPEHDPDAADVTARREALTAYYGAGRDNESTALVGPASGPNLAAAGVNEGGAPATSFGRPDDGQINIPSPPNGGGAELDTPAASPFGRVEQADTPPTPTGGSGDADEGQVAASESGAAIGTGTGRSDHRSSESLVSHTSDASMTPSGEYANAPASRPSGIVPSQRPAGRPSSPQQPEAEVTPASGFIPSDRGGAPADVSRSDQEKRSEEATATAGAGSQAISQQTSTDRISPELEEEQPERANEASAELAEEQPGRTDDTPPKRRFARETGSRASRSETKSRAGGRSGGKGASRKSSDEVPIARYDSLTAAQVVAQLRKLSQRELAKVERYEKRHENRQTVLGRIKSLQEDEPWRGYDDATVDEVKKKLADVREDRAKAVRDYERRHRDRKGVMEAARRTVASA